MMNNFEWSTKYIHSNYKDEKNGDMIRFYPFHKPNTGTFAIQKSNGDIIQGEYETRVETGIFYFILDGSEYLFKATEVGFNLVIGDSIHYCFTKIK